METPDTPCLGLDASVLVGLVRQGSYRPVLDAGAVLQAPGTTEADVSNAKYPGPPEPSIFWVHVLGSAGTCGGSASRSGWPTH